MATGSGMNVPRVRELLGELKLRELFISELGWANPRGVADIIDKAREHAFTARPIAMLGGAVVFEVAVDGGIPDKATRAAISTEVGKARFEHLLIFLDDARTQSLWRWVKHDGGKAQPREHSYFRGQPGGLFISKLAPMFVDISDLDETGNVGVADAAARLQRALDVESVTRKFYEDYRKEHLVFISHIQGIENERDRQWYASVLLNRLMFVYFMQRKGFLNPGDRHAYDYLQDKLAASKGRGADLFYQDFLRTLFFEGFAKPAEERAPATRALIGDIVYLNGGLFLQHPIEERWRDIRVADVAFENILQLFGRYSWNLDDTPGGDAEEISPDVLGYIFEKYINQKAFGAYYTPPEITEYLCERTIHALILDKLNEEPIPGVTRGRHFADMGELLLALDAPLCRALLNDVLPSLSLLDPACGSGAFLVAAMRTLVDIYSVAIGKIDFLSDGNLKAWLADARKQHRSIQYFIKKRIITDNLFGVDIMEEAAEIARLRLFLALVSSAMTVEELEPLPNIDFNILTGNSLIGLLRVDAASYDGAQPSLLNKPYDQLVAEKNRLLEGYRHAATYSTDLRALRDNIQQQRDSANTHLNELLLDDFTRLGIKHEQAGWDAATGKEGKPVKRGVQLRDINGLMPFHWGYEFDQVMNERGGFDAIITNPPWEIFKPNAKEFFAEYSDVVTKNTMRIEDFESEKVELLGNLELRTAWLDYLSRFPHLSAYYRSAKQYENQISVVNGKKAGADINLYKLFTEQCFNLLRPGGQAGLVIPSGIYTDLGTKQLREMLFSETQITGLFGFENRKAIFENVDSRFKFVVLTFEKGGQTASFPSAFMRHDVAELDRFPTEGALPMSVELVRRLSPDSLSLLELDSELDVKVAEKTARFPALSERSCEIWNVELAREFDMTNDRHLFKPEAGPNRVPFVQGGTFHQFDSDFAPPQRWIDLREGRAELLGRQADTGQQMAYQGYRLVHRRIARNTDTRTMIATVLPRNRFCADTAQTVRNMLPGEVSLFVVALLNSFVVDAEIRRRVTAHCDMHFVYTLHVPRLTDADPQFRPIVERAARLICTTPEFDELAREVGLRGHADGVTDPTERARLRAELDGTIAHLYGLTEDEFAHILGAFPLVAQSVKDAALVEYRRQAPRPGDAEIVALIARGESNTLELKEAARWDATPARLGEKIVVKTVAAFLNGQGGDLLLGVRDDGAPVGLAADFATLGSKPTRDGYEQFMTQLLINALGAPRLAQINIKPHTVDGKDVFRINVKPSPTPVWAKDGNAERFYMRASNTTRELTPSDAFAYIRDHWG